MVTILRCFDHSGRISLADPDTFGPFNADEVLDRYSGRPSPFLRALGLLPTDVNSAVVLFAHVGRDATRLMGPPYYYEKLTEWLARPKSFLIWMSEQAPNTDPDFEVRPDAFFTFPHSVSTLRTSSELAASLRAIRALTDPSIADIKAAFEPLASAPAPSPKSAADRVAVSPRDGVGDVELAYAALIRLLAMQPTGPGKVGLAVDLRADLVRLLGSSAITQSLRGDDVPAALLAALANLLRHWIRSHASHFPYSFQLALRPDACIAVGAIAHGWLDNTVCCASAADLETVLADATKREWFLGVSRDYLARCERLVTEYPQQASPATLAKALGIGQAVDKGRLEAIHNKFMEDYEVEVRLKKVGELRNKVLVGLTTLDSGRVPPSHKQIVEFLADAGELRDALNLLPRSVPIP